MLRFGVMVLITLILTACATNKAMNEEQLADILTNDKAVVFMTYTGDRNCSPAKIYIKDTSTKNGYYIRTGGTSVGRTVVEPGKYHLIYGSCGMLSSNSVSASFSDLLYWFEPITVNKGEVLYLGHMDWDVITKKSTYTSDNAIASALNEPFGIKDKSNFFFYAIDGQSHRTQVDKYLQKHHPELVNSLTVRMPKGRINRENYENLIEKSFARNPDGSYPTTVEAKQKLQKVLTSKVPKN